MFGRIEWFGHEGIKSFDASNNRSKMIKLVETKEGSAS
jgi:hypothetical protein